MKRFLICYLCVFVTVCLPAFGQYRFDTWTTDNGLPQNGLRQITQSPEGYLWFTTFDGLVRFDGLRFTTFNKSNTKGIINNRFTGIYADSDGTIYATTMEDGVLTILRGGVFTSLTSDQVPGHYIGNIEKDAAGQLRFLVEDDDRRSKSWYRLIDGKFDFIEKQEPRTNEFNFDSKSGKHWKITTSAVIEPRSGASFTLPLDLSKVGFRVNTFEDDEGALWIGENRVHRIKDGTIRTFSEADGLPANSIYHSFWQETDGSVWFTSGGASSVGLGLVQIKGDSVHIWGHDHGLQSSSIFSSFIDREGTAWLATDRGLSRRRKQVMQGFSQKDGIDHYEVYPLLRDHKGDIGIGSTRGLNVYHDGNFRPLQLRPENADPSKGPIWQNGRMSVQSLWEDPKGTMWVGLNGGIFLVNDGVAKLLHSGSHVFAIHGDRDGNVWAATNKGLLRFLNNELTGEFTVKDGLPNEFMTFIFEDSKNVLWFGGYGGLSKFENGTFTNFTTADGLVGNYVRTIHEDADGAFWIGTYDEGMSRFKDGKFTSFTEQNGLYNSGVFAIEEDTNGYFWISSNRGIYRVRRQDLNDLADGRIAKINSVGYGKEDGMISTECNGGRQPASIRDENGRIWFPTQDGVVVVDPLAETSNPLPPTVVIEEVQSERQPIDFRGGVVIEPGRKDLEIRYTGISLIKSDQVKFQYRLEPHDADWVDAGTRRTAFYSYLPPGEYTFHVKAANSDGVWSDHTAAMTVTLKPFFYQTWLFVGFCVLLIVFALLAVWKISVYQLTVRERKLTKLVTERTQELAEANRHLERLANSDSLTKIANRRRFESFLSDELHRAVRFKTPISLVLIDIDHFKSFNDTYGHQAGDEVLQKVAEAFVPTIKRPTDLVARFGGEEFAFVLGGTDAAGALQIAQSVVDNVKRMAIEHNGIGAGPYLTVSVGIATDLPVVGARESDLIRKADKALYQAKADGRDRIYAFDESSGRGVGADVLAAETIDAV